MPADQPAPCRRRPVAERLNKEREACERRFGELVAALPLPPNVDKSLLWLPLLGAVN